MGAQGAEKPGDQRSKRLGIKPRETSPSGRGFAIETLHNVAAARTRGYAAVSRVMRNRGVYIVYNFILEFHNPSSYTEIAIKKKRLGRKPTILI